MKTSFCFYIVIFLFLNFSASGQIPQLLKAEGEIPKDFITPSTVKYNKQVEELSSKESKRREKKNKKQFILESNFAIDDILQSGLVLFNDPASVYVNEVLNNLPIKDRKLLSKNPRAYVLNSSAVNAFATDQGIVFVTLGLLANLENEAQLAFILAHELIHIKHQHAVDKFIKSKDIDKGTRNINKVAVDRNIFKKSMYSRSLEEEADEEGLAMFLKSNYDPKQILNTFKILYYAYLPFDEVEMKRSLFEDKYYVLPAKLWLDSLTQISTMQDVDVDEDISSHPSSFKRLEKLRNKVGNLETAGKKAFLISEKRFFEIQEKARYQIPFLNLYSENYAAAIYTSHLMLDKNPNDLELKKVIGKALYMIAKYEQSENYYKSVVNAEYNDREKVEGASAQIFNLLREIDDDEQIVLALKYNWKIYQENKEDTELKTIIKDMFVEFGKTYEDLSEFSNAPKVVKAPKTNDRPQKEKTKLEKIEENTTTKNFYWQYAFVDELNDDSFNEHFENGIKEVKRRKKESDHYNTSEGSKELSKERKKEKKKGKSLGIKDIVVVNPFYLSVDVRNNKGVQYIRSEEQQDYFSNAIKKYSKDLDINVNVLDVPSLSKKDIEKFNDVAEVNQYFSQQMNHFDLSLTPGYNQNQINTIAEKYGTDYFLWTGVISLREKKYYTNYYFAVLVPYIIPFLIPSMLKPEYDMFYYAILFDVKTARRSVLKMDFFDKRDSKAVLNAHIYDVFHQIGK